MCKRKASVEFPATARGWIALHNGGFSEDQIAIVMAKAGGSYDFDTVRSVVRSVLPNFISPGNYRKTHPVHFVEAGAEHEPEYNEDTYPPLPEPYYDPMIPDELGDIEAFLTEHGHVDGEA